MVLCRDVYHCLPSQLRKEDAITIHRHLHMMDIESDVKAHKEKTAKGRKGKKGKKPRGAAQ